MKKPQKKRQIAIHSVTNGMITFYAPFDVAMSLNEFGSCFAPVEGKNSFLLIVDARYDLQDVVDYIDSLNDSKNLCFKVSNDENQKPIL